MVRVSRVCLMADKCSWFQIWLQLFFLLGVSLFPLNDVFIDVDTENLNDVLSSSEHTQVNENDRDKINVQNCDGDEDESINKEKDNFD